MKKLSLIFAMVLAGSMAMAQNNDAILTQVGEVNDATITQVGNAHQATTGQYGNYNDAFVKQTADFGRTGEDLGKATVTQQGSENLVRLNQRAFYGDAFATIVQKGYQNKVYGMTETADFLQNHGNNILDVYMEGNNNTLKTLASEAQKNINTFELLVVGHSNTTAMSQHFGLADVDIHGNGNDVTVKQYSATNPAGMSDYNLADIDIFGSQNDVSVDQLSTNNYAKVYVDGSYNNGVIVQTVALALP